ncbi:DNA helicase RecQ [Candidatus Parcubacteria bacterium]|nr:DNA helicase RecQ [Candidatus Parcubacteria bacterium]
MKTILKKYFGYDDFRPLQEEIINNVIAKNDSFVLMPTGGGKSLCYQLPAIKLSGITLVVSPLIALMKDQVDSLRANGVEAEFINSSLLSNQIIDICNRARENKIKILYIAPERFALLPFQNFLKQLNISLIAIDEAHCISEWGHDFRPDYRNLNELKRLFPQVPLIALTATATNKVRQDILNQLNLNQAKTFISSFDRENLNVSVIEKKKAFPKLVNLVDKYKNESVIIYCFSRKETEEIAENLKLNGYNAGAYHAGLETNKRKLVQELFIKDQINIIVATIAFGMGIDKPDVRLVAHYTYPKTLEGYYQEIGRAGRDGLPSECVMFYTYADTRKHEFFINQIENDKERQQAQEKLNEVLNYAELTTCRKKYLLKYFGENLKKDNCHSCDICLTEVEMFDATEIVKKILSAIIRTGNRFGKNYIIDVLLGKKVQRVKRNNHDKLSVFGIVKDFTANELGQIINHLNNLDYSMKSDGTYPTLSITHKGANFLQSDNRLELPKQKIDIVDKKQTQKDSINYNTKLFEILRKIRKILAEENNVPPYVIFSDKSLQEMAYYFPNNKANFKQISGVGELKFKKFGDIFIETISGFSAENNIEPKEINNKPIKKIKTKEVKIYKSQYYIQTKELLKKKISIDAIAKRQDKKPNTIIKHIEKLIDAGENLDLEYLKLPRDRYEKIKKGFNKFGNEFLKPVFEYFNGEFDYDELQLVRVLMQS